MKNKRVLITSILILLVLFVAGASYLKFRSNSNQSENNTTGDKSVFTSIKDALSKNVTLVCDFNDETGSSVKSYVKNGAIRITTTNKESEDTSGDIIMKDKKMYMWDLKTKQGFVYDIPDAEDNSVGMTSDEFIKSESYLDLIDKYKDSCKVSSIDDSYFNLPTDVKFQDMSKFLEDLKSQMPQGYELPNQ